MIIEQNSINLEEQKFDKLKQSRDFTEVERFHILVFHRELKSDDEVARQSWIELYEEQNDIKDIINKFRSKKLSDEDIAKFKVYIKNRLKKYNISVDKDIDKEVEEEVLTLETRKEIFDLHKEVVHGYRKKIEEELKGPKMS